MGLFNIFKKGDQEKSWEEENLYTGELTPCPECGELMSKKYVFSDEGCANMSCPKSFYNEDDDDNDSEALSVYDAALIWTSNGKDEDYTFGYSEYELEEALK